jgi:hypothetical protein
MATSTERPETSRNVNTSKSTSIGPGPARRPTQLQPRTRRACHAIGVAAVALAAWLSAAPAAAVPFWGAKASQPVGTPPTDLQPGEWVWNAAAAPRGPITVLVALGDQRAYVYRNGVRIGYSTVSSGRKGYDTPTGVFTILQKDRDHRSNIYNNAPMPDTMRLTWGGVALHAGGLPGYPSSHGCVHLPSRFADALFDASPMGMTVVVVGAEASEALARPTALSVVDPWTGATQAAPRLAPGEPFRWEPDKSPAGPVALLFSTADERLVVLRNGVEIGRARATVHGEDRAFGAHVFVVREPPGSPATAPPQWIGVAIPGHEDDAGRAPAAQALARVALPAEFRASIAPLLVPGTTLYVTDLPILPQSTGANLTVLTADPPT